MALKKSIKNIGGRLALLTCIYSYTTSSGVVCRMVKHADFDQMCKGGSFDLMPKVIVNLFL